MEKLARCAVAPEDGHRWTTSAALGALHIVRVGFGYGRRRRRPEFHCCQQRPQIGLALQHIDFFAHEPVYENTHRVGVGAGVDNELAAGRARVEEVA